MAVKHYIIGLVLFLGHIFSSAADCSINTPGVYTFGPECQHMCHCKNGASCDEETGECSLGCDSNWFGPACQYRDLAQWQFSRHVNNQRAPQYADNANDGNTLTCSYTQEANLSNVKPWWRVWFPQNETISYIYIVTTNDQMRYFAGFEVTVEYVPENQMANQWYVPTYKHTCYQNSNTVPGNASIEVQCDQPIVGNQVRVTLPSVKSQLVLCDVRIGAGRNFAFRKAVTASQSNISYPPLNAVDGRLGSTTSTDWTGCFADSNTGNNYLDINLGTSIYTYSVNINTSSGDYIKDYQIYTAPTAQTGLQLAYNDTGNWPPVTYVHLNTYVQQLRIATSNTNQMVICELEIFGECPANKCGYDCSENCYCKSHEDMEHRISGVCTTGCQVRWTGPDGKCNIECDDNKWGTQCQNECGACRIGTCDVVSGECTGGCQDGNQVSADCKTVCPDGKYGQSCMSSCSKHCIDVNCNKANGACLGGCKAGYTGTKCDQECPEGTHGINCKQSCSANCADVCNYVQGTCTTCKAGWIGEFCNTECDDGTYGIGCAQNCVSVCATTCDKVNGHCLQCPPGWKGNFCETECNHGQYGINCAGHCGFCKAHTICDKAAGACPSGCMTGYTGATCDEEKEQPSQSNTIGIIAGSVVAGIVVICITVVVVCVVMYRRNQLPRVINEPHVEMSNNPIPAPYEDLHQNDYMNDKEDENYETISPDKI